MKIKFKNFWSSLDPADNFILKFVPEDLAKKDFRLEITSVYEHEITILLKRVISKLHLGFFFILKEKIENGLNEKIRKEKVIKVWFTGENIRPPIKPEYDFFLSFDQDDFGGKNFYFPIFEQKIFDAYTGNEDRLGIRVDPESLTTNRFLDNFENRRFACATFNNLEPMRIRAVNELSKYGEVDLFGIPFKNQTKLKSELADRYKFVLCFENDLYPGYVTEKLLDAYVIGGVPLYWGDLGRIDYINTECFINLLDFESIENWAEFIGKMKKEEFLEFYSRPLLKRIPKKLNLSEIVGPILERK